MLRHRRTRSRPQCSSKNPTRCCKTSSPPTTKEEVATLPDRMRPGDITTGIVVATWASHLKPQESPIDLEHPYATQHATTYNSRIGCDTQQEGIFFSGAIQSQEGRPGTDASEVMYGLANMAHTYPPGPSANDVRRRLNHKIRTQCQVRLVSMIRASIPPPEGQSAWVCLGVNENHPDDTPDTPDTLRR